MKKFPIQNRVHIVSEIQVGWFKRLKILIFGHCHVSTTIDCENLPGNVNAEVNFDVVKGGSAHKITFLGYPSDERIAH